MLEALNVQAMVTGRGRKGCLPHGPYLIAAVEEGRYRTQCLKCGLVGPERKDSLEAKLAFDQWMSQG